MLTDPVTCVAKIGTYKTMLTGAEMTLDTGSRSKNGPQKECQMTLDSSFHFGYVEILRRCHSHERNAMPMPSHSGNHHLEARIKNSLE